MHRFLSIPVRLGYIYKDEKNGQDTPTLKVYLMGVTVKNRLGPNNIVEEGSPEYIFNKAQHHQTQEFLSKIL